jgi:hypothetical protein
MLTREQYINTVSDLLGFDVRPLVKFADAGGRKLDAAVYLTALAAEERLRTAEAIAAEAAGPANLPRLSPCDAVASESACADQLIDRLAPRAFRRPLAAAQRADLRQLFDQGRAAAGSFASGVEALVAGVLQAPEFLYLFTTPPRETRAGAVVALDDFDLASRMSYFLWNSAPDDELTAAAAAGRLASADQVSAQARRLLAHPRAVRMREDFYRGWLELDNLASVTRQDPAFTPALAADLGRSILEGIHAVYRGDGKSQTLLGDSTLFLDDRLARLYAPAATPGADLKATAVDRGQRRGLLTHPALMTVLADADASDPIRRGKFVRMKLLCGEVPEPLDDIPDLPPLRAGLSTRQRLEQHRSMPACRACHQLFDPIGMAFESFDFVGRFREQDQGVAVDTSGEVIGDVDVKGTFARGMELVDRLAGSADARRCLAGQFYRYAVTRDPDPAEKCALAAIEDRFAGKGDLNDLLLAIAVSDGFRFRQIP